MAQVSSERNGEYVRTALLVLMENDDSLPSRDVTQKVGERLDLDEYELELYQTSSNQNIPRWSKFLHFNSISAVKAGWLIKDRGI